MFSLLGALAGLLGALAGLLGALAGLLGALLHLNEGDELLPIGVEQAQFARAAGEADAQARANPILDRVDRPQPAIAALPADQFVMIRVVQVIFLNAIAIIELIFTCHLRHSVAGRKYLEDDLGRDIP